jgi:PTH2 family peptidyl-tRNA hydrolase
MTHKQVIVIRKDLKMRRGKEIAQGAHASLGAVLRVTFDNEDGSRLIPADPRLTPWLDSSFTKVTVTVNSEAELLELHEKAKTAGLITCLIQDSGKTEFNGVPTFTTLAVGPDTREKVEGVTGHLPLY